MAMDPSWLFSSSPGEGPPNYPSPPPLSQFPDPALSQFPDPGYGIPNIYQIPLNPILPYDDNISGSLQMDRIEKKMDRIEKKLDKILELLKLLDDDT